MKIGEQVRNFIRILQIFSRIENRMIRNFSQTLPLFILAFLFLSSSVVANTSIAPEFWLSNVERVRFDSRQQTGPYVISFFFIGCVPCVKEIPALHDWMNQNSPDTDLLFISPIKQDSKKDIERYAASLQVPTKYFYSDPFGNVLRKFFPEQAQGIFPTLVGVKNNQVHFVRHTLDKETFQYLKSLSE